MVVTAVHCNQLVNFRIAKPYLQTILILYLHKIYPQPIFFLHLLNCLYFFEVLRHYFDVVQFIFERCLWSEEGKSYVGTVFEN